MSNFFVLLSPAINVVVTGIFAGVVLSQYVRRHRPYQLYWFIGLLMAFIATLAYVFMLIAIPTSTNGNFLFHVYYILGILVPAWLGLGSMALVLKMRATYICLTLLYLLSIAATILILLAQVDLKQLGQIAGTTGTGVLLKGPWLILVIVLNTVGVVAVVGVAFYSGYKLWRRQHAIADLRSSNLLWGNILILTGDIVNAVAGTLARILGLQSAFWVIMALGWVVFFVGVLLASRRTVTPQPTPLPAQEPVATRS